MRPDELATLMRPDEGDIAPHPDVTSIRARGARLRRRRRGAIFAGGAAVVAMAALATPLRSAVDLGDQPSGGTDVVPAGLTEDNTLSRYERKVLDTYPDAYRAGGAVIWPHALTAADEPRLVPDDAIAADVVPIGQHEYGYFPDNSMGSDHPDWVYNRSTADHVYEDLGPSYLLCNTRGAESDAWTDGDECRWPSIVTRTTGDEYATQLSLGTEDFLTEGSGTEVFMLDSFEGKQPRTLVLGGLDGTDVARVVLDLADGRHVDAKVASGTVSPGNTLWWASVDADVTGVTSYGGGGDVVDEHPIEACDSPEDCEVR